MNKAVPKSSFARDFPRLALAWAAVTLVVLPKDGVLALLARTGHYGPANGFATIVNVSTAASLNALLCGAATAGLLGSWRTEGRRVPWYGNVLAMLLTALLAMAAYSLSSSIEKALLTALWIVAMLAAGYAAVLALFSARAVGVVGHWIALAALAAPMVVGLIVSLTNLALRGPAADPGLPPAGTVTTESPRAFVGRDPGGLGLMFDGEIVPGDTARLAAAMDKKDESAFQLSNVAINSDGGDVHEAMALGRLIRKRRFSVSVSRGKRCLSSCVLVLAGRWMASSLDGVVGVHRPYWRDSRYEDSENLSRGVQQLQAEISSYLEEMNVSSSLAEIMMATSPDRMRPLTKAELHTYMLSQPDPAAEEEAAAEGGRSWGITSSEYRARAVLAEHCGGVYWRFVAFVDRVEGGLEDQTRCVFATMRGVDATGFAAEERTLVARCGSPDSRDTNWVRCAASFFGVPEDADLATAW
jgi:hypothetical protein